MGPGQERVFHGRRLGQIDFVICFYSEIMQIFLGSSINTNKVEQASNMLMWKSLQETLRSLIKEKAGGHLQSRQNGEKDPF